ncbi:hypothetical protein [Paraglaciecola arctica]|uniref:hypothetical protein n=1 Tax=Paraglaciecola arctica TaxID=1128911 RepID=UPI001C07EE14|nr:hypothetical protein [Paraglaciecola arctica]MBU3005980.1 hypothetical protein [Paraglaciecola arctica]
MSAIDVISSWKPIDICDFFDLSYKKLSKKLKRGWLLFIPHLFYAAVFLPLLRQCNFNLQLGANLKFIMLFLILFSSFGMCNDSDLQKEIIGSWITGQQDEYFGEQWFITEYKKDGTAIHRQFKDATCQNTSVVINGIWNIQNGQLTNIVLGSTGDFEIPSGLMLVDQIIKLANGEMIISTDSNRTAYRMKSDKCI